MVWGKTIKLLESGRASHRHNDDRGCRHDARTIYALAARGGVFTAQEQLAIIAPMLLSAKQLADLAIDPTEAERYGPGSETPAIAFSLADADPVLADRLADMPCPVIGLGSSAAAPQLAATCDVVLEDARDLALIERNVRHAPYAAMVLVQHLRASADVSAKNALVAESLAFASLQAGPEFGTWRHRRPAVEAPEPEVDPPLRVNREEATLLLTLNRPNARNAINAALRDALCEALDLALADPSIRRIELTGEGRCFSEGGDVAEFGQMLNVAEAHRIRSLRLPAHRLCKLADRLAVHVNGAAIGAGVEMAAFAARVTASPRSWFQLPELRYGLLPGAGGTVSLPRRIGRQRTAYMALTMCRVPARQALAWGLVDAIAPS